jgi:phosphoenolpyruvate-protein phosphotransferase (PTS system enzyme I)
VEVLHGIPVSPGIAVGKIRKLRPKIYQIGALKISPEEREAELKKLEHTLETVLQKTDLFIMEYAHSQQDKDIFESQKMILQDPDIKHGIQTLINDELLTVEQAVTKYFNTLIQHFQNMENEFFAQRANDFQDVSHILMDHLVETGKRYYPRLEPEAIIFAKEITPSQVSIYAKAKVKAICTEKGSYTSHSSILARAYGIPFIVAVPSLLDMCKDNTSTIIDAITGDIFLEPNSDQVLLYNKKIDELITHKNSLKDVENCDTVTASGKRILLMTNLDFTEEIETILHHNIDGIGLFRTEYLYINRTVLPTEELQFALYKNVAEKLDNKPLIIRTFDLGGDKLSHILNLDREENPYLGCRGIRFSLIHKDIFKTQIRAILRASVYGNIKIMFPMVIGLEDMREGRQFVSECMKELESEGKEVSRSIEIGAMIEIPSAALCAGSLAEECDFFSIGTNDLVQYTLAVDRNNEIVARFYKAYHPSVIALIRNTVEQAHLKGLQVSVCGEMASEPQYVSLLLALDIDALSVNPQQFLAVKDCILHFDEDIKIRYDKITTTSTLTEIKSILDK